MDFDPQPASEPRRNYITKVVNRCGRDQRFLLALIFSDPDPVGCSKILRRIIRDYRGYIIDALRQRKTIDFDDKKACLEYCNCVRNALSQDEIFDTHTLRMLQKGKLTSAKISESSFAEDLRGVMKPKGRPSSSGIHKRLSKLADNWKTM